REGHTRVLDTSRSTAVFSLALRHALVGNSRRAGMMIPINPAPPPRGADAHAHEIGCRQMLRPPSLRWATSNQTVRPRTTGDGWREYSRRRPVAGARMPGDRPARTGHRSTVLVRYLLRRC